MDSGPVGKGRIPPQKQKVLGSISQPGYEWGVRRATPCLKYGRLREGALYIVQYCTHTVRHKMKTL